MIWNHNHDKASSVAKELGDKVVAVNDRAVAVKDADVIVTVTNSSTPVLMVDWVKPGAHVNGKNKSI